MPTFNVIEKATARQVYQYQADKMIEWDQFPFARYDHVAVATPASDKTPQYGGRRTLTKLEYRRLFSQPERTRIDAFTHSFETAAIPDALKADIRTALNDYAVAQDITLDDEGTIAGTRMYEQLALIAPGRADEVLNG